jgi:hypothetical protein
LGRKDAEKGGEMQFSSKNGQNEVFGPKSLKFIDCNQSFKTKKV